MSEIYLMNPSFLELDDSYRGMPKHREIEVKTSNLQQTLKDMEKIGFVAIEIVQVVQGQTTWTVNASKGKHGPCKFTGSYSEYRGVTMAALDDDLHLMPANQPIEVCDKTYAVHMLPAYNGLIIDSTEDVESKETKGNDQDDFDYTLGKLYQQLKDIKPEVQNRKMLFYPGPFRLLILWDGTMLRRGKWNAIPSDQVNQLKKEGLISSDTTQLEEPVFLQDQYEKKGASALMDELKLEQQVKEEYSTDLKSLDGISKPLKERLLKLIEEHKKYFVLVGSDLSDELGCCPSEEVTEANRLVNSGILSAYSEPDQGEACPLTFYSIKGELSVAAAGFDVEFDTQLRKQIQKRLTKKPSGSRKILRLVLLAFVLVSSLLAARRFYQYQTAPVQEVSYENLLPLNAGQLHLVLFHNEKRCHQCLQMEEMVTSVIDNDFSQYVKKDQLAFQTIVIDDPVNQALVNQLGIFAATLVFMEFDGESMTYARILTKGNELYRDEAAFKDYLKNELTGMLAG